MVLAFAMACISAGRDLIVGLGGGVGVLGIGFGTAGYGSSAFDLPDTVTWATSTDSNPFG